MRRGAAAVVAALALAAPLTGCLDFLKDPEDRLRWDRPLQVTTAVPGLGNVTVAWGGAFAITFPPAAGVPTHHILTDDAHYTSRTGTGWVVTPPEGDFPPGAASWVRLLDLRWLLRQPDLSIRSEGVGGGTAITATGTATIGADPHAIDLRLHAVDDRIRSARLTVDDPGSPFLFKVYPLGAPVAPEVPARALTPEERLPLDDEAHAAHQKILGWVGAAEEREGTPPQEVTPQRLSRYMGSERWPANPFTGAPVAGTGQSGDFVWRTCGSANAVYRGLGWDGALVHAPFGGGCS